MVKLENGQLLTGFFSTLSAVGLAGGPGRARGVGVSRHVMSRVCRGWREL